MKQLVTLLLALAGLLYIANATADAIGGVWPLRAFVAGAIGSLGSLTILAASVSHSTALELMRARAMIAERRLAELEAMVAFRAARKNTGGACA